MKRLFGTFGMFALALLSVLPVAMDAQGTPYGPTINPYSWTLMPNGVRRSIAVEFGQVKIIDDVNGAFTVTTLQLPAGVTGVNDARAISI